MKERGIETIDRMIKNQYIYDVVGYVLNERPDAKFCIFIGYRVGDTKYRTIQLSDGEGAKWNSLSGKRLALKLLRDILLTAKKIPIMGIDESKGR